MCFQFSAFHFSVTGTTGEDGKRAVLLLMPYHLVYGSHKLTVPLIVYTDPSEALSNALGNGSCEFVT